MGKKKQVATKNAPPPKKARTGSSSTARPSRARSPTPPPPPQARSPSASLLNFDARAHRDRFEVLSTLPMHPTYTIDYDAIRNVGLFDSVSPALETCRWTEFLAVDDPVIRELFLEFLTTFVMSKGTVEFNKDEYVRFRLGGLQYGMSLNQFALSCGFYDHEFLNTPECEGALLSMGNVDASNFWNGIARHGRAHSESSTFSLRFYNPRSSKSTAIVSLPHRYLHRLIAYTICGRRESTGVVTLRDLFYLYCFIEGLIPHLGYGFALYMEGMAKKKKGALCGGSYITRLAKRLGVFNNVGNLTQVCPMQTFNLWLMSKIKLVAKRRGRFVLIDGAGTSDSTDAEAAEPDESPAEEPQPQPAAAQPSPPAPSQPSLDPFQQYQLHMMNWMADGLQNLCRIQGIPLGPRPVYPGSTSVGDDTEAQGGDTEPLPTDDDAAFGDD